MKKRVSIHVKLPGPQLRHDVFHHVVLEFKLINTMSVKHSCGH